jgi:exodeoxyribonuclease V alpha subunit
MRSTYQPPGAESGALAAAVATGVLEAADVHVAATLARLAGETDPDVMLAAGLTVRATRLGSVCLDLGRERDFIEGEAVPTVPGHREWLRVCAASPMVATSAGGSTGPSTVDGDEPRRPLRLEGSRLYLDRYWRDEESVASALDAWARRPDPPVDEPRLLQLLHEFFPGGAPDHQRLAAAAAATGWFTIVAGGPGTGKTTTVARVLATMAELQDMPLRVALAAPTGKAAARLAESVDAELGRLGSGSAVVNAIRARSTGVTVHRLLGSIPGSSTRFRHDRGNHLPHDLVVIDEASMLSLSLIARVVEALGPHARLMLVGDPDQLVSIEAGAVLGDLVNRRSRAADARAERLQHILAEDVVPTVEVTSELTRDVVRLRRNHRFERAAGLVDLADAIRRGDPDATMAVLHAADGPQADQAVGVEFVAGEVSADGIPASLRSDLLQVGRGVVSAATAGDAVGALRAMSRHRVLCAHREGPAGVSTWGRAVAQVLAEEIDGYGIGGEQAIGRPLLVTANDYALGLFNGDTGVVILRDGEPLAAFGPDGPVVPVAKVAEVQTLHAMTIHKAQGSELERVTVVLPDAESPLLTRELLYTAVTRARSQVRILGTEESVRRAVLRPVVRASGLRER